MKINIIEFRANYARCKLEISGTFTIDDVVTIHTFTVTNTKCQPRVYTTVDNCYLGEQSTGISGAEDSMPISVDNCLTNMEWLVKYYGIEYLTKHGSVA